MADITKCTNKNCPLKEYCFRWTASDSEMQSYAKFTFFWEDIAGASVPTCDFFIANSKTETKIKNLKNENKRNRI